MSSLTFVVEELKLLKFSASILAQNLVHSLKHCFQFINKKMIFFSQETVKLWCFELKKKLIESFRDVNYHFSLL